MFSFFVKANPVHFVVNVEQISINLGWGICSIIYEAHLETQLPDIQHYSIAVACELKLVSGDGRRQGAELLTELVSLFWGGGFEAGGDGLLPVVFSSSVAEAGQSTCST